MKRRLLSALMLCLPLTAQAELVTVGFAGQLNNFFEQGVDLGVEFEDGEAFTGQFTYDSLSPLDPRSFASNAGDFSNALVALRIDISGYTIVWDGTSGLLRTARNTRINNVDGDHLSFSRLFTLIGDEVDGTPLSGVSLVLTDSDGDLYATNSQTQSLTPVFDFGTIDPVSRLQLTYEFFAQDPDTGATTSRVGTVSGPITNVFIVPEPASLALLGLGGLVLTQRRRAP